MPLVRIDALEGRSKDEVKTLLDAAHRAGFRHSACRNATATRFITSIPKGT